MLNQLVIVGRIVSDLKINETEKESIVTLAVPRGRKNEQGLYDTDFIKCVVRGTLAKTTIEYCKKGDIVGIRGSIEALQGEDIKLVAERVTFLSSRKEIEKGE